MNHSVSISSQAKWLEDAGLQSLLAVLCAGDEEARIAGGAVRNTLLGEAVDDIDIAVTLLPDAVIARCNDAGWRTIPTGVEHGTVTVIAGRKPYEITTLRADIETDGRHATVRFGRDWLADAQRRDFTINALYADADGSVFDPVGGLGDIHSRTVRFIGDANARITEDYLRILRFFRFFARYGSGRPDAEGLKACARHKAGMAQLSAERIWSELKKILTARDPSRALLWMRQTGVLTSVLPETEKWGIDLVDRLMRAEGQCGWRADPISRLQAIIPPDEQKCATLADRLRLSGEERARLCDWAKMAPVDQNMSKSVLHERLYREGRQPLVDHLRLAFAASLPVAPGETAPNTATGALRQLLAAAERWKKPEMPVLGRDLLQAGFDAGPQLGLLLARLEDEWIKAGFTGTKAHFVKRAKQLAGKLQ